MNNLNTFQRVVFDDPDYFSFTDFYITNIKSAYKLRSFGFDLYKFHLTPLKERFKYVTIKDI